MKAWRQVCAQGARTLFDWIFSFALWTLWLALVLLLAVQLYIVSANELAIPNFALREIETRLAASGLRATFSRTSFDPTGRVLIENVRLSLPAYAEPVVTVRSLYLRLNPLALVVGKFEPSDLRITGGRAAVPGMLSPSGQSEEIVNELDATLERGPQGLLVHQASARVAGVIVSAQGTVPLARSSKPPRSDAIADFLANRFPSICRQAIMVREQLTAVDAPTLDLDLASSESGAIAIQVTALARAAKVTEPFAISAVNVRATTRLLLFGDTSPSHVELSADEVRLPLETQVRGVHAMIYGRFDLNAAQFDLRETTVAVESMSVSGVDATGLSVQIFPRPLPQIAASAVAHILGASLSLRTNADLREQSAEVRFEGAISPLVLDLISQRVGSDVRRYCDFKALTVERAEAIFDGGWKFTRLDARIRVPWLSSYGIILEDGRAEVELDPRHLYSPQAFARVGENFAHGSYEHDFKTKDYRFLLDGQARPLAISGWFREWWPNFFQQFQFPVAPPVASADVSGTWGEGGKSRVFVFADAGKSIIRGTEFTRVRTRLFIRPGFYDGLEVLGRRGEAKAHGRFTLVSDPETHDWQTLDLGLESNFDLKVASELLGPTGAKILAPFQLAAPPEVKVQGSFPGPAAPAGSREKLHIAARTKGAFRFHQFPLQDVSFTATVAGDEIVLDDVTAQFGGGTVTGHARVWDLGQQRRLGFDCSLQDASLGQVVSSLQEFFAAQKNQPPGPPGKFVQEKANVRLELAASAEGRYDDPFSFRGEGNATLRGAGIGEVPLLGTLSDLFKFTALRFTEARTNFKIEGAKVVFREVELRGANSAVDAHGEYALDRRDLDFNAKVFPFHESGNLLKSVVGAVLTPLSNVLEVKLTGSLEKPQWAFVRGPTNFLRTLAEGSDSAAKPPPVSPSTAADEKPAPAATP